MSRIHRLPPDLANQIAAGEVVERPASVVKELVENAVDAGASRVAIRIEFGGKALVAVEDDGEGMTREDATLALERHATSKIRTAVDLAAIRTLGFRGEALPSVASVSRFMLRTRLRGALAGTRIRVEAGRTVGVDEVGAPEGTLVEVADLFYNLPARRKFLKADSAEAAQVSRLVTQLALGYWEVGFTLRGGRRLVIDAPPASSLEDRFYQLYGDRPDLVPVAKEAAGVSVRGLVAGLGEHGPARGPQHVFVNRRLVRDRTIAHAIQQAYGAATIKERRPEVHLFVELPPERVDVNVHPAKAEVRFLDQGLVHEILRRAVVDALGQTGAPELALERGAAGPPASGPVATVLARDGETPVDPREAGLEGSDAALAGAVQAATPARWTDPRLRTSAGRAGVPGLIGPMRPLGQFRNTFIVAVDEQGLAIIDQHVAHERVLFEQIVERLASRPLESQRLLDPLVLELGADAHETLLGRRDELARFGFDVEDFGGTSLRLSAVPALLGQAKSEGALRALAADLDGLPAAGEVSEALAPLAATMACHAAVKANDRLTPEKMQYLLDELVRTAHSSVCPHGRPVVLRLTRHEIERSFERI